VTNAIGSEGEVRLARVTYLPGVTPPAEPTAAPEAEITASQDTRSPLVAASNSTTPPPDLPPKRLHNFPTGELERLTPAQLQQRMDEFTRRDEPEIVAETAGERTARSHKVSMAALTRKGLSSAEMTELLRSRDLDAGDIAAEVTRLEQVGLIDDRHLAQTLVMQLRERKGLGRSAISAELRRRKLDPSAIEEALDDAYEAGDDELSRARAIAVKRAPQLRSLDPETARRRLGAFLMRKGYSGSIVASAVAAALAPNHPSLRQSQTSQPDPRGPRFE
jgi:SOS response regulatory protein OraA/RecX